MKKIMKKFSFIGIIAILFTSIASLGVTYEYDEFGRVIKIIYDDNRVANYEYDTNGNVIAVTKDEESTIGGNIGSTVNWLIWWITNQDNTNDGTNTDNHTEGVMVFTPIGGSASASVFVNSSAAVSQTVTTKILNGVKTKTYSSLKPFSIQDNVIEVISPNENVVQVSEIDEDAKTVEVNGVITTQLTGLSKENFLVFYVGEKNQLQKISITSYDQLTRMISFHAEKNGRYIVAMKPSNYNNGIITLHETKLK